VGGPLEKRERQREAASRAKGDGEELEIGEGELRSLVEQGAHD